MRLSTTRLHDPAERLGRKLRSYTPAVVCKRCGQENPPGARFCLACGAPLEAELSKQERKLVSVLFVDLVDFTGRSDRADPEDVRDTLRAYQAAAQQKIEAFGGTMEKFIGDAVMAVFGAPLSYGDDAERAVKAGLGVLEAVAELRLQARAGVNTGEAVVTVTSGPATGEALAMGDVVNTASRLQSSAAAGSLVVGEETYKLTRNTISYRALPPVDAKGKAEPLPAWLAVTSVVGAPARTDVPMVGRDRELALLTSIWDGAAGDRHPHLVTVVGPPGIGKSRLQREFSRRVQANGGAVLRGRCLPYGERAAYGAFTQMVRGIAGIYEDDPPDSVRTKLTALIEKLLPTVEAEETTRHIFLLTGLGVDQPAMQRDYLFFAARRVLESFASDRPALVVFEDLHWADAGLLDLIQYLATHVRDVPLVIVGLARPEFLDHRSDWGSGLFAHTTIGLEPLTTADAGALAQSLLAKAGSKEAVERLAETAEGNPLFVEELAAAFSEGTKLGADLPTTVRAAIAARLDALPDTARAVLLDASVIGRTLWRGVLVAFGGHRELDEALAALEIRDFIRRVPSSRVRGDIEYQFKHMLIRDVAYATLPRSLRRERHAAVATYIESVAGQANDLAAFLAHHWREAGEPEKAIDYLLLAADQALDGWALQEAVSLYDAALELATDDARRRQIRLARGLGRSMLDDTQGAVDDLGELLPELTGRERIEGLLGWIWGTEWTERSDETIAGAQEALQLAQDIGDPELIAVATGRLSQGLAMRGDSGDLDRSAELGERALRIWVPGTRSWDRINHQHMYGEQLYWMGRLSDAGALMAAVTGAETDPHSLEARLRSASLRATVLTSTGRYEEGLALFEQTLQLAQKLGRPIRIIQNYSTLPLRDLYDLDEARRRTEDSLAATMDLTGFTMPRANARADLVQAALLQGDIATAENQWRIQWEDSINTKGWARWLITCRLAAVRAEMEVIMGRAQEAVKWAQRTIELCVPTRRLKYEIVGRTQLGRALVALGKGAEAIPELRTAVEQADRLSSPPQRWQTRAALGRALYATGDDNGAEQALAGAAGVIREMAGGLAPARAARFLAAEPIREVVRGSTKPV
jgi:class 3 adenylate cyclase/tetratricopeptide (TPR) repeat protein